MHLQLAVLIKTILSSAILIVISTCVSAVGAEYGTRILFPELAPSSQIRFVAGSYDEPTLGPKNTRLRQVKNAGDFDVSIQFNKYGLRDTKDLGEATPSDYFVVGDSLMFGWGVEEGKRLSDVLQNSIQRPVYNVAIPTDIDGYEKLIEYAKKNGAKVNNVVLVISEETNLKDYDKSPTSLAPSRRQTNYLKMAKYYLMGHSALYFLVTSFIHKNPTLKELAVRFNLIIPNLEGIAQKAYSRQILVSSANRAAKLANQYKTIVAVAPSRAHWYGEDEERAVARRIHSEFVDLLRLRGLPVVDFKETFEENGTPLEYSFKNDAHWNAAGHATAAAAIVKFIKSRQ